MRRLALVEQSVRRPEKSPTRVSEENICVLWLRSVGVAVIVALFSGLTIP